MMGVELSTTKSELPSIKTDLGLRFTVFSVEGKLPSSYIVDDLFWVRTGLKYD
jgi:hypothetical protein